MILGALLLLVLFWMPLWNITLEAPQYPDPIGMNIHIDRFEDANPNDIKNINIMNHYVGMKEIPQQIPEFSIFPYVVFSMSILGVVIGFLGVRKLYIAWFALMLVLGTVAMYDFYLWEYDYGHDLKENAAIKFTDENGEPMVYQPPLIGSKTILNFRAISQPKVGAYFMFLGMVLSVLAYIQSKRESQLNPALVICIPLIMTSCNLDPKPIMYGADPCTFCSMTIVDKQHSALLVTEKGRTYKYDAVECLINDLQDWDKPKVAKCLVADFSNPGQLTNAASAHYLVCEAIPSPMGGFLSAFAEKKHRDEVLNNLGGTTYTWKQLNESYSIKKKEANVHAVH